MARPRAHLAAVADNIGPRTTPTTTGHGLVAAITAPGPDVTSLPTDDLTAHPRNVRTDLGDLTELTDSITTSGIIQPLIVARDDAHGWLVIAGHRRLAAARNAGLDTVPVVVRDDLTTDDSTTTVAMLIENIHRADLTPLDEAAALRTLADNGLSQREISRRTGISQAQVSKRLSLLKLPDRAKTGLADGTITVDTALKLGQLPARRREDALTYTDTLGVDLTRGIELVRRDIDHEGLRKKILDQLADDDITVIEDPNAEFGAGNSHLHRLWGEHIQAAKDAGTAVAYLPRTARFAEHINWFCTTPKPWPWQDTTPTAGAGTSNEDLDPTDHVYDLGDDSDDQGDNIGPDEVTETPGQEATETRRDALAEALGAGLEAMTDRDVLRLLTDLILVTLGNVDDLTLVARLLGTNCWDDRQHYDTTVADAGAHARVRHALAACIAEGDTWLAYDQDRPWDRLDQQQQTYLHLLHQHLNLPYPPHQTPDQEPA